MKRFFYIFLFCYLALGALQQDSVNLQQLSGQSKTNDSLMDSRLQSKTSDELSLEWNNLSKKFTTILQAQKQSLQELNEELTVSRNGLRNLQGLLKELSAQNGSLREFNQQIGQRMQERDEELALAYQELDRQDELIKRLNGEVIKQRLILIIILVINALVIAGAIVWKLKLIP